MLYISLASRWGWAWGPSPNSGKNHLKASWRAVESIWSFRRGRFVHFASQTQRTDHFLWLSIGSTYSSVGGPKARAQIWAKISRRPSGEMLSGSSYGSFVGLRFDRWTPGLGSSLGKNYPKAPRRAVERIWLVRWVRWVRWVYFESQTGGAKELFFPAFGGY